MPAAQRGWFTLAVPMGLHADVTASLSPSLAASSEIAPLANIACSPPPCLLYFFLALITMHFIDLLINVQHGDGRANPTEAAVSGQN